MYTISLGTVTVTTHDTANPLSAVLAALGLAADLKVHKLKFWPLLGNTNPVYVGLAAGAPGNVGATIMVGSTGVNVLRKVSKPAATGQQDHVVIGGEGNSVRVADYAVDVTTDGEGFQIFAELV